jgi:hypothetical protein
LKLDGLKPSSLRIAGPKLVARSFDPRIGE